jgi:uncharacterized membrane protein YkoI
MQRKVKLALVAGAITLGAAGAGVAAVGAMTGDDAERPITVAALDQATRAALAHTGGGRVTETEVGDEESYYEVEVTLDDGSQVDVQLDAQFRVVGSKADRDDTENDANDD